MKQKQLPKQVIVNAAVAGASCLPMGAKWQRLEIGRWVTWWSDKLETLVRVSREENPFHSGAISETVKKYKSALSTPRSAASEVSLSIKTSLSLGSKAALTIWVERWEEQ